MGKLLEFIFFTILAYLIFKYLNRLFSSSNPKENKTYNRYANSNKTNTNSDNLKNKNIKWDAETIDFEELETNESEKKDEKK